MTNEEWDRKTEFLLNQSAKFDAGMQELQTGMQELKEAQAISEKKIAEVAEAAEHALEVAEVALEGVSQLTGLTDRLITTMGDGFRGAFDRMKHMDAKMDVLVDSQIRTDERLRDLTDLSERYFRKNDPGRNGSEN